MRSLLLVLTASLLAVVAALSPPLTSLTHAQDAQAPNLVARGRKLLDMQGCTACHSLDGSVSAGPTFYKRFGTMVDVLVDDKPAQRRFDAAYVRESIEDPAKAVTVGFAPGVMPKFTLTEEQLTAITAALAHLGQASPDDGSPEREPPAMHWLALFVLWFVGGHLVLSSLEVRQKLVARLGERTFQRLYSVLVAIGLGGTIWAYMQAPYNELWPPFRWTRYVPLVVMPIALLFLVAGFTTKTPTQVGQHESLKGSPQVVGILRITRHPQLWGYVLFAVSHLPPNGDQAALLFFGAFAALAIFGMMHIERRREATHGAAWQSFAAQTSLIPFFAIIEGRNELVLREIGWWRLLLTLVLYGVLLASHEFLFGASPLP